MYLKLYLKCILVHFILLFPKLFPNSTFLFLFYLIPSFPIEQDLLTPKVCIYTLNQNTLIYC